MLTPNRLLVGLSFPSPMNTPPKAGTEAGGRTGDPSGRRQAEVPPSGRNAAFRPEATSIIADL